MSSNETVIYIISDRRSGSTLLENMLSKSQEVVSVGELSMLKGHIYKEGAGALWDWNCSCGKPVLECPFWSVVLKDIYTDGEPEKNETEVKYPYNSAKVKRASLMPSSGKNFLLKLVRKEKNKQTIAFVSSIYRSIFNTTGKRVIVDSSKTPIQALALFDSKQMNAKFIFLTRDLRAITISKIKRWKVNKRSDNGPFKTLINSYFFKKLCEAVMKIIGNNNSLQLRYEDLAQNPQKELDKIFLKFGVKPYPAPEYMELLDEHTIAGTPGRFERKKITIDSGWKDYYKKHPLLNAVGSTLNKL